MRFLLILPVLLALAGCTRPGDIPLPVDREASASAPADTVIYELYVRSFTPEGTFSAIVPRLDELRALGVTTLWLMPIHPVGEERRKGELGSPYSIADYTAVNPAFGTLDDFRALVREVHARDMTILLDLVANHTAWDHPWVTEHPDWYATDAAGAITHPPGTDWTDVAQLDFGNPDVRAAMRAAMRFWVEDVGVDGYRADVAELVPLDFWREAIDELRAARPVLMLAEGADPALHEAGFDLTYDWRTYHALKDVWQGAPADTLATLVASEPALPNGGRRMRFTTNHDETAWDDTPIALFDGAEGARAAAVIATTLPGVPLIYNGQEVGDPQRLPLFEQVAIDWDRDPALRTFYTELLALRAARPALRHGRFEPLAHEAAADVLAFRRTAGDDTALVLVNVRPAAATVSVEGREIALAPYGWHVE